VILLRAWALIGPAALLTACSSGGLLPVPPSPTASPCTRTDLTVTWTAASVRAENTSGHACTLSGTHAVWAPWWRTEAPGPSPAAGTLVPHAALVQDYRPGGVQHLPRRPVRVERGHAVRDPGWGLQLHRDAPDRAGLHDHRVQRCFRATTAHRPTGIAPGQTTSASAARRSPGVEADGG